jgi:hypothetical protein
MACTPLNLEEYYSTVISLIQFLHPAMRPAPLASPILLRGIRSGNSFLNFLPVINNLVIYSQDTTDKKLQFQSFIECEKYCI